MKILIVIHSLQGGGAERAVAVLSGIWARGGNRVSIATLTSSSVKSAYELEAGVECKALDVAGKSKGLLPLLKNTIRRIFAIRRVVQDTCPDVVISFIDATNIVVALACIGLRVPTIGCERVHPPMHKLTLAKELARKLAYGLLDFVVAQTDLTATWLRSHTLARRVVTIPNVCLIPIPPDVPYLDPFSVTKADRNIVLAVGRLSEQKGHNYLLDAFSLVSRQAANWDLVILGDGPLDAALRTKVMELNLEGRVFLPGRAGNISDWYERATIFVLSSLYEGFPNVLVEAMAYGLPAISFDCPTGPSVLIQDLVNGRLVPTGDRQALAKCLLELMNDEPLRQRLAQSAKTVRERFSEDVVMKQWNSLLNDLVSLSPLS